jgi:hypothetical protein
MDDCATSGLRFETPTNLALEVAFDGGRLTSDGGLTWLAKIDEELGLCEAMAPHVPEWRKGKVRHSLWALIRQRVFQIACGYEDQNDANSLRADPLLKLVCGSLPETGSDLASQPTISRLENAADARACYRMAEALFELYVSRREEGGPPKKILLDFDATADPAHGEQEGSYYHGYYEQHIYHPLLVFDGESGHLITAILRAGAYEAGSWERERRVIYKAEAMEQGTNTRFVVTSRSDEPEDLYDWYIRRGESENWIKDFKLHLKADRLSCHRFIANQFRLLLHAMAYWLLDALRKKLVVAGTERMQLDTLRLVLSKIGGWVRELLTRVKLHLASSHPGQRLWQALSEMVHE